MTQTRHKTKKATKLLAQLRERNGDYNTNLSALRGELQAKQISLTDIGTSEVEITNLQPNG
ncbi:MAG: hypothetical protein NTW11_01685 [Candidatus Staskawiczbacteria bacterium]|nr:hypothetical protein [Candidatus Staskawiczbacteria bacterium]